MRVLVTGGAGFIGSNLSRLLLERGHSVAVLDDLSTGLLSNLSSMPIDLVEGSILDPVALASAAAGAASIVHLAARPSVPRSIADPVASHEANASGTLRVLEAARATGSPQVIVASSSSVYGANPALPKHEQLATRPLSPYAASKLATESYALAYQHSFGIPTLALRFFNVFGPGQLAGHAYAAVIPAFVHAALAGEPLTVHGDGTQTRDFTYVGSVCRVIADAVERRVSCPEPVNLAFGSRVSLLTVIEHIEQMVGRPLERNHVATRAGDVPHSQADAALLHSLFPQLEPVPFAEGLRATIDWFRTGALTSPLSDVALPR